MKIPASIETFQFADKQVQAYIPSLEWIQKQFDKDDKNAAPYWAQVWPAAKALCEVIANKPVLVKNKLVLEIAAGLGLPSLLSAQFAKQVIATDYIEDAVEIMKRSADYNKLNNLQCSVMDWNKPDRKLKPEVLLLSDVNYEPGSFDTLYKVLSNFIEEGAVILLSTPQRLVAKSFMDRLQPWCRKTYNIDVKHKDEIVFTTVWLLAD
jgi:predicted nicotinamide N-methyase